MKKRLLYLFYALFFFLPAISLAQTANHVVISELFGGNGGAYVTDWIELYNPTGADVDMSGWSVQYNSATSVAAFSGVTVFPTGTIIKSHGYFLVQEQGTAGTLTIPTPDMPTSGTTNNFNMSSVAGKVALVNIATAIPSQPTLPSATIVDLVAYGTTVSYAEGGTGAATAAPALTTTTSIERKASATSTATTMATGGSEDGKGNGYDSDNNANDFFVSSVINPQNSASPLETPPGATVPTLLLAPTSLDFGTSQTVGTTSAAKSFTITGANLTAGATVTVTAPYSVSTTAAGTYSTSVTLTQAQAASQTIYVEFTPTTTTAAPVSLSVASTGATTQTISLTGTGASATPTLTAGATSLTFSSQAANTVSAAQTFTLSGTGLTANTTVSVAAPFAVSKDGINYSTLITYTPAELAATTVPTVSVEFAPTAAGSPTGTITIASAGATSKTVSLSGTATAASGGGGAGIANHVVISELFGGNGGAYVTDWIELYNPTGADVDMSGWSVQYNSATSVAAFSGVTVFPTGTIIKSHGYFLVQEQGTAGTLTIPTPDMPTSGTTNNFNMSSVAGKVALVNIATAIPSQPTLPSATIVDLVAYGTTVSYAEGGTGAATAAPALTTTTSIERKASATSTATTMATGGSEDGKGNGYDSDNNANDFFVSSVINPQNSASPLETPPGGTSTPAPVLAVATTPTTTPTSIDFGTTQTINTTSAPKSFTITGTNLTAGATVTTTAPYSISTTAAGTYSTSVTLTQAQAASQTIYIEFTPTTTSATTGSVTVTSAGAIGQGVILTGTGTNVVITPSLTATPATLAFGSVNQGVPSVKSYTLAGANLATNNTTVTATGDYSLSKAVAGPFTTTLSFTPAELGAATAPSVYVQFSPTVTGADNSTITNTNTLVAGGQTVTVTGTGIVPVLTAATAPVTTPTSIDFGNQTTATSATKSYVLTGANLITASTTTVTSTNAAYTVSKTNGSGYATSITFSATEIAAGPTVYVQFTAGTLGATPGTITNTTTGTGATGATVLLTGTSVAAPVPLLTLAPTSLTFSSLVGSTTAAQSYTITGANITGASSVTVAAPYSISKTSAGTYGTTISYLTTDFPSGSGVQTVWVKFSPTVVAAGGANNGTAVNTTAGGTNQNLTLNGTGIGVPALTATGSPLTFSQIINTTSAAQSFTLSAAYLTANATLTVAAPYTISKTSTGGYATSLSYSTAELASQVTVYVQFTPTTVAAGGANNGTVTIASTGATSQTVTLNGTGLAVPVLTTPTATTAFGSQSITAASAPQSFVFSGANITSTTTVTAPAPYTISKTSGGTYSSSLTYTPTEMATAQTVYVIFAPTATGSANGTITVATPGATNATVSLTGTGIPPPNVAPTLNAIADVSICYTPAPQTIALSGISPTESTQSILNIGVTSSNPALFSQLGILPLTATTAQINYTIANGATGTAVVTVTLKDNGGTANGGIDTYTRTFNVTVNALAVVSITSDTPNPIEKGKTIQLTATGGTTYTWSAANSADIVSGGTSATVILRPGTLSGTTQTKGPYVYTVTATNGSGCSTVQTYTVNTFNAIKLVTSNVITPNGDGINDTWQILNIELYPTSNVKVFDKAGKMVFTQDHYLNTWNGYGLNGAPLTQGTYYYVVDLGSGTKYNGYISIVRD